jgi:adenosylcobinamide-GDP ribazoletransferase
VLSLGLRVALLASVTVGAAVRMLVVGHVLGRASVLLAVRLAPPADPSSSGAAVAGRVGPVGLAVGAVLTVVPVAGAVGWFGGVVLVLAGVVTVAVVALARAKIGGISGDVLGATNQIVHVAAMAVVAGLARAGHV